MSIRPPRFRGGWHEVALDVIGRHSGRLNISSAVILDDFRSLAPDCDLPDSEILSLMFNESATRSLSLKLERPLQDSVKNVADLSAEHLKLVRAAQSRLERKKTMSRISDMEKLSSHPEETDRDKAGLHDAGNKSHDLAQDENPHELRQSSDINQDNVTPSPDTIKLGAGAALAEHSKDAKAPKVGRSEAAYTKKK